MTLNMELEFKDDARSGILQIKVMPQSPRVEGRELLVSPSFAMTESRPRSAQARMPAEP